MIGDAEAHSDDGFRRDAFTWTAFGALLAFGFLNAVLGPALPYLRAVEHISYLVGALHQVAFAVGGGLAGLLAARSEGPWSRAVTIRLGLCGAAVAGLGVGYGDRPEISVTAALFVSLLGTSALIRLWAALADAHPTRRAVAMTEGEVAASLGGVLAPLLVGGLAATTLSWRFAFVIGGAIVGLTVITFAAVHVPRPVRSHPCGSNTDGVSTLRPGLTPTLVVVFAIVALEFSLSFWLASYLADSVGLSRGVAVTMVGGLYAANLLGRLVASRLARRTSTQRLLAGSLAVGLAGLPILLTATNGATAIVGIAFAGAGTGATFPLTSALHVAASDRGADSAVGQVLATAAVGQMLGPLLVGGIAQSAGLRVGLVTLPGLAVLAGCALARHQHNDRERART